MSALFASSYLKIERARRHIHELEALLDDHARAHPPIVEFTEATETSSAHLNITSVRPPLIMGAIVGDALHNLRAALDLMAVELVSLDPNNNPSGVLFPFCDDADYLPTMIRKRRFHLAGQDAVDLLAELKPYKGGNIALRALHDLDVQDKHHTLIAAAAFMTSPEVMADTSDFPNVKIKLVEGSAPSVGIVFPNDSHLAGQEIIPTLHELTELVEGILKSFASLVASRL
jgi:hypothetical protein